jgi:hypothetical protein
MDLTVTTTGFANSGTIRSQGDETVLINGSPPSSAPGGTISYYGTVSVTPPFGAAYTNLVIESTATATGIVGLAVSSALTVNNVLNAASLSVSGTAIIGHTVTITGVQSYGSLTVNTGGSVTATSSGITIGGGVTVNGGLLDGSAGNIAVSGTWAVNSGTWTAGTGTVTLNGSPQTVNGDNTFHNLTCTGATVFEGGKTQTVTGVFDASGATSLESTSTAKWILTVPVSGFSAAAGTFISNCQSTNYLGLTAGTGAADGTGNIWVFALSSYTWEGNADTDWATHDNWDGGQYPPNGAGANVTIPNTTNKPVASASLTEINIAALTLSNVNSSLDLAGKNLTVTTTLTNSGTILLLGSQTVTVPSTPATPGTISYYGTIAISPPFGAAYTNLTIESGATATAPTGTDFTVSGNAVIASALIAASLSVTGTSTISADITTTDAQTYNDPVTLGADVLLDSGTGDITFYDTIEGGQTLTLAAGTGKVVFAGDVGTAITPLTEVTVTSASAIEIGADITTVNAIDFNGYNVTLTQPSGTVTLKTTGTTQNITLRSIYGPTKELTLAATGTAIFAGHAGSTSSYAASNSDTDALGAVIVNSEGGITVAASTGSVNAVSFTSTSTGAVAINSPVTVHAASGNAFSSTGTGTSTFINGSAGTITATGAGGIKIDHYTSNTGPGVTLGAGLSANGGSIDIDSAGTLAVNAPIKVDTTADTSTGTITLDADTSITLGADLTTELGAITLGGTLTGTISTTAGLTTVTTLGGATGSVTFNQDITNLGGDLTVTTGAGAGNITFSGTISNTASRMLALTAGTGTIVFAGEVGTAVTPLTAVTVAAGAGGIDIGADITTVNAIDFSGHTVTLKGTTKLTSTGDGITLEVVEADTAGTQGLTLDAAGVVNLSGAIGAANQLAALTVSGATGISVASTVETDGLIDFGSYATTLTGSVVTLTSNNDGVKLLGAVNATTSGVESLKIEADTAVSLGIVGGGIALSALTVTADSVDFTDNVATTASSAGQIIKIEATTITGASSKTLSAAGAGSDIEFTVTHLDLKGATINPGRDFIIIPKGGGDIEFGYTNLYPRPIHINPNFSFSGKTVIIGGSTYTGDIYIASESAISGMNYHVQMLNTSTITQGNNYTSADTNLTLNSGAITLGADIDLGDGVFTTWDGVSTYSPVTLAADVAITANGDITLGVVNATSDGTERLTLNSSGVVTLTGNIGTTTELLTLAITGATRIDLGNSAGSAASITTANTLDLSLVPLVPLVLVGTSGTSTLTVTTQDITLGNIRGPGKALTLSATGTATFAGHAGSTNPAAASNSDTDALGVVIVNSAGGGVSGSVNADSLAFTTTGDIGVSGPVTVHAASGSAFSSTGTGTSTFTIDNNGSTTSGSITAPGSGDIVITHTGAVAIGQSGQTGATVSATGGGSVAITASATGSTVAVNALVSTLNTGSGTIAIDSNGTTTLAANVTGGIGDINFGTTGTGGVATSSALRTVSTASGAITFHKAVTLDTGGDLTVTTGAATAGDITFNGTINGGQTLALTPGMGKAIFKDNVGSGIALAAVTVGGSSSIEIDGDVTIRTTGSIAFNSHPLTLPGATTTTAGLVSTSGSVSLDTVSRTGTGTKNLILTAASGTTDSVSFNGTVGSAPDPLGTVNVTQAGGGVTVSAAMIADRVSIASAGPVAINSPVTVHAAGPGNAFSSTGTGTSTFTIDNNGSTTSGSITASGSGDIVINHTGAVAIGQSGQTGATVSANGGGSVAITASATGSAVAVNALVSTLNTGTIAIDSNGTTTLAANVTGGTEAISFGTTGTGGVSTSGIRTVSTTGGNITFNNAVIIGGVLNDHLTITTGAAGDIIFNSTIDATAVNSQGLELSGADVILNAAAAVGQAVKPVSLKVTATGTASFGANLYVGDQSYSGTPKYILEVDAPTISASAPGVYFLAGFDTDPATSSEPLTGIRFTVDTLSISGASLDADGGMINVSPKTPGEIEFGYINTAGRSVWYKPDFSVPGVTAFIGFSTSGSNVFIATSGALAASDIDYNLIIETGANITLMNTYASNNRNLTLNATNISLGANISLGTGAFSTQVGATTVYSPVTLTDDVAVTANGGITLDVVTGAGNNLTLAAGTTGNISVSGTVGTGTDSLGDIMITSAQNVTFSSAGSPAPIYAASFIQGTGSGTTTFNGTQDYSGVFTFTGTNLTINNALTTTGGVVTINNTGAFTTIPAGDIIAGGGFSQTTTAGTVELAGDITTTNANAPISFVDDVKLTGDVEMNSSAGNGDITLSADVTRDTTARSLTLNAGTSGTGAVNVVGSLGTSALQLGAVNITGAAITTNGINSNSKTEITNSGLFTSNAAIVSAGGFEQLGTGSSILKANITTTNNLISFVQELTIDASMTTLTLDTGTGAGDIALASVIGPGKNLTFTAGTGDITVSGTVGTGTDSLGIVKVSSATDVNFEDGIWATSFDQSDTLGTGSGGSGLTQFNGPQDYTAGFSFIGTNLTVNNTLATDTNSSGGDGAILITNVTNDVNFIVGGPSGSIEPGGSGGTITVNGNTTNNGTITAADITSGTPVLVNGVNYYKVIDFNGNYTSNGTPAGTLIGASPPTADQLIIFRGDAAFGAFTHNGDTVQFSTSIASVMTHAVSGTVAMADVLIDDGNTVTLASGTITQDDESTLTLNNNAILDTTTGSWIMGADPTAASPDWIMGTAPGDDPLGEITSPYRSFTIGFAGLSGELVFLGTSELRTMDFYTRKNEPAPSSDIHTVTLPTGTTDKATITAAGNVVINETFGTPPGSDLLKSTLVMTGAGKLLTVRCDPFAAASPKALVDLGNFTAGAGGTAINSDLVITGDLTISTGAVLSVGSYSAGSYYIHMAGNGERGSTWTIEGTFNEGTSTVEFGKKSDLPLGPAGGERVFTIAGSEGRSNWYNFVCHEPRATLKFSSWVSAVSEHKVTHNIEVTPQNANGDPNIISGITPNYLILLTKDGSTPTPPAVPGGYTPPDTPNSDFWYFNLESNAMMYMHFVYIQYSFSKNRIPLPLTSQTIIVATPYVYVPEPPASPVPNYTLGTPRLDTDLATPGLDPWPETAERAYYNVNWLVNDRFLYSFTEDWNGNGRIDRIRAQAAFDIDEDVSGFEAVVEGYTVTGYVRADKDTHTPPSSAAAAARMMDMLYIYVEEKDYSDTGARPVWWVKENNSVKDNTTRSMTMRLPYEERLTANDNAPPRINYTLTLPDAKFTRPSVFSGTDLGEIYVQFSEPVDTTVPMEVFSPGDIQPLNSSDKTEFIIPLASPYNANVLVSPPSFTLNRLQDNAVYASDKRSNPDLSYNYQYPSPKYPTDWTYSDYMEIRGNPAQLNEEGVYDSKLPVISFVTVPPGDPVPETVPRWDAETIKSDTGNKYNLVGPYNVSHRVTDLQISVPPTDLSTDNRYFAWPLWAMYDPSLHPTVSGSLGDYISWNNGYVGPGSWYNDRDIIWDFTGRRSLEASGVDGQDYDVTMQVRINSLSSLPNPDRLVYSFNVSDEYKGRSRTGGTGNGSPGFWLPEPLSAPPVTPVPYANIAPLFLPLTRLQPPPPVTVTSPLFNYKFSHSSNPAYDNKTGIEFYFHLAGSPPDLYAGRLEMDAGGSVPLDWYYRVRPFSFGIHNITRQRNTATILNNVINPTTGERVYLDYDLQKSGRVTIQVFTLDGNLVKVLERRSQQAGKYRVSWDGRNNGGRIVARGMYFIRIVAPDIDEIRKVMVVK